MKTDGITKPQTDIFVSYKTHAALQSRKAACVF